MTTKKHEVSEELLASLLADCKKPEDLIGENGLLKQLTKQLVKKARCACAGGTGSTGLFR